MEILSTIGDRTSNVLLKPFTDSVRRSESDVHVMIRIIITTNRSAVGREWLSIPQ